MKNKDDNSYYRAKFDKYGDIDTGEDYFVDTTNWTCKPYEVFAAYSIDNNLNEEVRFLTADVDCLTCGLVSSTDNFENNVQKLGKTYNSYTTNNVVEINKDIRKYYNKVEAEIEQKNNELTIQENKLKQVKDNIEKLSKEQKEINKKQIELDNKQKEIGDLLKFLANNQSNSDQQSTELTEEQKNRLRQSGIEPANLQDTLNQLQNKLIQEQNVLNQQQDELIRKQVGSTNEQIKLEILNNNLHSEINELKSFGTAHMSTESLVDKTGRLINHGPECYHYYPEDVNDTDRFLTIVPENTKEIIKNAIQKNGNNNIDFNEECGCFIPKGVDGIIYFANICRENGILFEINPFYPIINDKSGILVRDDNIIISKKTFDKVTNKEEQKIVTEWARARTLMLQPDFSLLPNNEMNNEEVKNKLTEAFYNEYIIASSNLLSKIQNQEVVSEFSKLIEVDLNNIEIISTNKQIQLDNKKLSATVNKSVAINTTNSILLSCFSKISAATNENNDVQSSTLQTQTPPQIRTQTPNISKKRRQSF